MGEVVRVIWWRGWRIRRSREGSWYASKPRVGAIVTGDERIGPLIASILYVEIGYYPRWR